MRVNLDRDINNDDKTMKHNVIDNDGDGVYITENKSGRSKYKVPPKYNVVERNITLGYKQQIQKQNHRNDYGHAKCKVVCTINKM